MEDTYDSFENLLANETEGEDFVVHVNDRASNVAVLSIHGGMIEPLTTELTLGIAGKDLSYYTFKSLKETNHRFLHIKSTRFTEERVIRLLAHTETALTIHGRRDRDDSETVWVGGLDKDLGEKIIGTLGQSGFKADRTHSELSGTHENNICNKGTSGMGVQLEIPKSLRRRFMDDSMGQTSFCQAIQQVLT